MQFAPLIVAIATSIGGLSAALFSLISSLGLASLSLAAIIPAALAVGGIFGVLKLLFGDMEHGVMKELHDRMVQFKDDLTLIAQKAVAPGLREWLKSFDQIVPIFQGNVRVIAEGLSDVAHNMAKLNDSPVFRAKLADLFHQASFGAKELLSVVDDVIDMLVTLGSASGPIFQRLVSWIRRTIEAWHQWMTYKDSTGELMARLREAGEEASKWGQIIGNFVWGLVGMFAAAKTEGQGMSDTLLRISESFRSWAWDPEVHGKIRELIDFFLRIDYERLWQTATAISAIGTALRLLTGASGAISGLLSLLQLGPVGLIILAIAAALSVLVGVLVWAWFNSELFRAKCKEIYQVIKDELLPKIMEFWDWFENKLMVAIRSAVTDVLPTLHQQWQELKKAWQENRDEIKDLYDKFKILIDFMITWGIPIAIYMAATLSGMLVNALHAAAVGANLLNDALSALGRAFGGARDVAVGALNEIKQALTDAAAWAWRKVNEVTDALASLPGRIGNKMTNFVTDQLKPLLPFLGKAAGGIVGAATGGSRSGTFLVGEQGPELVNLPAGSRVRSNPDTRRMFAEAGSSQSSTPGTVRFTGNTSDALATVIMQLIRTGQIQLTGNFG